MGTELTFGMRKSMGNGQLCDGFTILMEELCTELCKINDRINC